MMNSAEMNKNNMFDFLDDGTDAESPERDGFVIDDDGNADKAVWKIRKALDEYQRLSDLAESEIADIRAQLEVEKRACDRTVNYYSSLLAQYFENTSPDKRHTTKTQESYKLIHGKLVKKHGGVEYKRDDEKLLDYLKANAPELVAVKESAKWAEFKKRTQLTADGNVIDTETGEILGCIQVVRKPDTFEVKF